MTKNSELHIMRAYDGVVGCTNKIVFAWMSVLQNTKDRSDFLLKIGKGLEADSFTLGGEPTFAAGAKAIDGFTKAVIQRDSNIASHTNGS